MEKQKSEPFDFQKLHLKKDAPREEVRTYYEEVVLVNEKKLKERLKKKEPALGRSFFACFFVGLFCVRREHLLFLSLKALRR